MDAETFETHLRSPSGSGALPGSPHRGRAGGAACGDLIEFRVELDGRGLVGAGFDAEGCGAVVAASSAVVELVEGARLLEAAKLSTSAISTALGGLSAAKVHAAELAADAFHRALGSAARSARLDAVAGRTLVAMSGGVDSAVAASLSAGRGEALAVTLELWRDEHNDAVASCCSHIAVRRARALAHSLGMAHFTLDLREEFRSGVVDPWLDGHRTGTTPNPCVQCNGRVRIEPMADLMRSLGAERLVTGHYARLAERDDPRGPLLAEAASAGKDQAYALARVPADVLAVMDFPLGEMTKPEVRRIAAAIDLPVANTPDSQDLCFLAGVGRSRFLELHGGIEPRRGPIVRRDGTVVGSHRGHFDHTVGQRRGLGIGGGTPLYVLDTDPAANTVTVGPRRELEVAAVVIEDIDLRRPAERVDAARLRHRAVAAPVASVEVDGGRATLRFSAPVEMVAPGQVACLLDGDRVVGCGTVAGVGA